MIFRRRERFRELIGRQLDLVRRDDAELWEELDEAEQAYEAADRGEAEERYGDYLLAAEACVDRLGEVRDGYARTLGADDADVYRETFDRAAVRRWKALSIEL